MSIRSAKHNAADFSIRLEEQYKPFEQILRYLLQGMLSNPVTNAIFSGVSPTAAQTAQDQLEDTLFQDVSGFDGISLYDVALGTGFFDNPSPLLRRIGLGTNINKRNNSGT